MSALKVLWKFNANKKHRNKQGSNSVSLPLDRSSSNQQIKQFNTNTEAPLEFSQFRRRAQTYSAPTISKPQGKRRLSNADQDKIPRPKSEETCDDGVPHLEDIQLTLTSPRHYLRRRALVQEELQDDVNSSTIVRSANGYSDPGVEGSSKIFSIHLQAEGHNIKETLETRASHSVLDLLDYLLVKNDIDLKESIPEYSIVATPSNSPSGHPVPVSLDKPSTDYAGHMIIMKSKDIARVPHKPSGKEATREEEKPRVFHTVQDCLDYFDEHGLVELPVPSEEESYQLPRVTPLEPIVREWEELPIDPQARNCLTDKAMEQQRAIWELIYNEHSHLKTLETIINVFMRCLELIHRAKVFTEDNHHNIFGYMEDLYHAHDQLWTYTLEPCLNKTYETKLPLDLTEILYRFPESFGQHFEIYEEHCTLDSLNISSLQKASSNAEFNTYLMWCESRSECNRQKLKEMLAKPMQQLTRYHLLIKAIKKKTFNREHKEKLEKIVEEVTSFVHVVNNGLRMQEETERVKDAMARITAYSVGDVPHELRELVHSYTHLDLLAPMPDVEVDKPRLLMVEGSLHYRDSAKPKMSAVYVFLFTDMLLITKAIRKSSADKYKVIHAPHKITSLVLHSLTSESIFFVVLNEYNVLSSWFILKASSATIAEEWRKQITAAQQFYQDAMSKKAQTWKLMENLRSERILNGVENLDSLSASLSQSLWSISSLSNKKSEYELSPQRSSTPSLQQHQQSSAVSKTTNDYSTRTVGARAKRSKYKNFRSLTGSVDLSHSLALQRTTSMGGIYQGIPGKSPGVGQNGSLVNSQLLDHCRSTHVVGGPRGSGGSSHGYMPSHDNKVSMGDPVHDHGVQRSPVSDLSSTEGSDVYLWDESGIGMRNRKGMKNGYFGSQKSATLPRQSRPRYSDLPQSKSSSHSPINLNESLDLDDSNTSLNSLSLPESSSNPLRSLLRVFPKTRRNFKELPLSRTRSHGEVEEAKYREHLLTPSPTPSINIPSSNSQPSMVEEEKKIPPLNRFARKKCNSVGSLDAPDLKKLLQPPNKNGYRKSLPCSLEPSRRLSDSVVRSLSSSEGSLWNPNSASDSYFNVLYVRDSSYGRSQKPNVETVDEEEEGTTKIKNTSLEEGEEADVSMASSSCTEVPLQKSIEELDTETEHVQSFEHVLSSDDAGAENDKYMKKITSGSNTDSGVEESTDSEKTQFLDVETTPTHKTSVPVLELFTESVHLSTSENASKQQPNCQPDPTNQMLGTRWIEQTCHSMSDNKPGGLNSSDGLGTVNGGKVLEDRSMSDSSNVEVLTPKERDQNINCEDTPTDKSASLFIIPEMEVRDVDSIEPEAMTPLTKARDFFKDMKEISSFSEDSDLDDLTPKDKFTLLHGWRNYESISIESDDVYSPTSVDEQKFNMAGEKKIDGKNNKSFETSTTAQDLGKRGESNKETVLLQPPAKQKPPIPNLVLPSSNNNTSSNGTDAPVSQADKYAAYSPLMKRKQHIPAASTDTNEGNKLRNEGNKLRRPQSGGELSSKSKVRQLSQMFEVKQQTTDGSSGKRRDTSTSKTDTAKKGTPKIRSKIESSGVETTKTRKESVSKIPVAGDKKKYRSVQSRKESFVKSPEPFMSADKLLPPKPTFRSRHVHTSERHTKHGHVAESASKYSKPVTRAGSAPQPKIKTRSNSSQETANAVGNYKHEESQDHNAESRKALGPRLSTVEILSNPEDNTEAGKEVNSKATATEVAEIRKSTEESKLRQSGCQETRVKCNSQEKKTRSSILPEPKLKPNTHRSLESKSKTSNSQVCKSSPTRTPRAKPSGLQEPTRRLSTAPEPKPKPRTSTRTKAASPQWEVLGSRARPSSKSPAGSPSLQRLNGNRFYNKQSNTSNSAKGTAEIHPTIGNNSVESEDTNNSLQQIRN